MITHPATLLYAAAAGLAEGPVWHDGALWWVDINGGTFNRLDPVTLHNEARATGAYTADAVLCVDGRWLIAQHQALFFYDWSTGKRVPLASGQHPVLGARHRFNDGKCDPTGRLWLGTLSLESAPAECALFSLSPAAPTRTEVTGVSLSNGLGWSPDGRTFYYIDTPTRRVDRFDYDRATGSISGRRPFHIFSENDGWPDGLAIDARGHVWVALYGGSRVVQLDAVDGTPRAAIPLPVSQVTSCAFGGADLATLYITTAAQELTAAQHAREPLAGALFSARPDVAGQPIAKCRIG